MRIGVFSDLFYPFVGGNENYLINLETRLIEHGIEVVHLTTKLPVTKERELYKGIEIMRVPVLTKNFKKGRFLFPFLGLSKIKIFKNVDLIQTTTYPASITGWIIGKILKKPTVLFCHEFFRDFWKYMRSNFIAKNLYPVIENYIAHMPYDWFICPSNFSKKSLIDAGTDKKKITVAYHGIDPIFNPKVDGSYLRKKFKVENNLLFGFTGRLDDWGQKGIKYLLEATKIVTNELPNAKLMLGGRGFDSIIELIKKLKIEDKVIYVGNLNFRDVPKFYSMCDIIAGASIAEGFGFMYAEASACGKAVVATNAGSIPEIIINGKTGVLVPPRDSKALAEAIIELLTNRNKARKMGKRGAKYVRRKFSWEKSVKKHLEVYEMFLRR